MTFKNPWSRPLLLATARSMAVIAGVTGGIYYYMAEPLGAFWAVSWLSVVILIPAALPFVVKSYDLGSDRIFINRLFHKNVIRYAIIKKVYKLEDYKKGLQKTMGAGGLFSFSGSYKNKELGLFSAFVNDWSRAVCVETLYGKNVLSPEDPDKFIQEVEKRVQDEKQNKPEL